MANGALGAVLGFDGDLLTEIQNYEKKVKDMVETTNKASNDMVAAYKNVATQGLAPLHGVLTSLIDQINKLDLAKVESLSTAMTQTANATTQAANSAKTLADNYNAAGGVIEKAVGNISKVTATASATSNAASSTSAGNSRITQINKEILAWREQIKVMQEYTREMLAVQGQSSRKIDWSSLSNMVNYMGEQIQRLRQERSALLSVNEAKEQYNKLSDHTKNTNRKNWEQERYEAAMKEMRAYYAEQKRLQEQEQKRFASLNKTSSNINSRSERLSYYGARPQEAMQYANAATSVVQYKKAIEQLTAARDRLNAKTQRNEIDEINAKIRELKGNIQSVTGAVNQLHSSHSKLFNISQQLGRQLAMTFSVASAKQFVKDIAAATGEMELQQVALRSILQNRTKADEIFNKTKELATKSPFRVQQLVTYSKQLAAYRVESDKLYDTTKRLADVSAGLGVDMQRLILAYGQVKAAAYLRGTEVRQFTEAGVNLYGELQAYFKEVKGEAYTTAQIVDMISKRKVTFEDVEQIFKRLTDQGGIFYNMQEIQSETLYGKIEKLKDLWYLMLNDIGQSNKSLLSAGVDIPTYILRHWENFADMAKIIAGLLVVLRLRTWQLGQTMGSVFKMEFARGIATAAAQTRTLTALMIGLRNVIRGLGMAIAKNPIVAAILAIGAIVTPLIMKHHELNEALSENDIEYSRSVKAVNELVASYHELQKAATAATNAQGEKSKMSQADIAKNLEEKKQVIEKLQQNLESKGIKLNIPIESLSKENIDDQFNYITKKAYEFERGTRAMKNSIDDHSRDMEGWFGIWGDNFETDRKDLANAEREIIATQSEMDNLLTVVAANYDKLTESSKKYYDAIKGGQKQGQSQVAYLMEVHKAMNEILFDQSKLENRDAFDEIQRISLRINADWGGYQSKEDEWVKNELQKVKRDFEAQNIKDPMVISAILDDNAAKYGWTEHQLWLAKQDFKVPLIFDPDTIKEEIKSIEKQLDDAFNNKTYRIDIKANGLEADTAFEQYDKKAQDFLKQLKAQVNMQKRMKGATEQLDNYNATDNANEIDRLYRQLVAMNYGEEALEIINGKKNKTGNKERDIWQERIDVLKKMQTQYNNIRNYLGEQSAAYKVKENFANAIKESGLSEEIVDAYVPTKKGLVDALNKVLAQLPSGKEFMKKRNDLQQMIAELKIEIKQDELKKELEKAKIIVENAFNGLTLFRKLSDQGLHDYEVDKIFPGLTKTIGQLRQKIYDAYKITPEMASMNDDELEKILGKDKAKQYLSEIEKLNKQEVERQRSTLEQLLKDYKNKLDDQLQIDLWYSRERKKIMENVSAQDGALAREMLANLDKERGKKTSAQTWKDFQGSEYYLMVFENLDYASKTVLQDMKRRLEGLKEELKGLDPAQLKAITNQIEKLEQQLNEKGMGNLVKSMKDAMVFAKERARIEEELINSQNRTNVLTKQKNIAGEQLEIAKTNYDFALKLYGADAMRNPLAAEQIAKAAEIVKQRQKELEIVIQQLVAEGKITEERAQQLRTGQQSQQSAVSGLSKFNQIYSAIQSQNATIIEEWDQIFGTASDELKDFFEVFQKIESGFGEISQGAQNFVQGYFSGNAAQMVQGIAQSVSGTVQVISGIFSIGDKKKERQIKAMQEQIDTLSKSYEKLKAAMDEAWSISDLEKYNQQSIKNLEARATYYEQMAKLESDKKKKDNDKIEEYLEAAEELREQIVELRESFIEELGGFGDKANYKSAAQEFADSWVDAFSESSNTLNALNEQFNDLIKNLVKKQAMQRFAKTFLNPLFTQIDNALVDSSGEIRSIDTMIELLGQAVDSAGPALENLDAAYTEFARLLKQRGIDITDASELSALQQGIQGVTETTAEAIEAYLNSMRWFLATQQSDVARIRVMLEERMGSLTATTDSPLLTELQAQTSIMRDMRSLLNNITTSGRNGLELKVKGIS